MKLVTASQMQEIDRRTIDGGHVASLTLMENAGGATAGHAAEMLQGITQPGVEVLCGKGNNGGDGLVIARLLARQGVRVRVHLTHRPDALSPDARANYEKLPQDVEVRLLPDDIDDAGQVHDPRERPGSHTRQLKTASQPRSHEWWRRQSGKDGIASKRSESGWRVPSATAADTAGKPTFESNAELRNCLQLADLCVDALLGTGVERDLRDRLAALINTLNRYSRLTLAVDVPSGVDATSAAVRGTAVWADLTVSFGLPKKGLVFHPGREHVGRLVVADIGFPEFILHEAQTKWNWFDLQQAREVLPRLVPTTHKYERGCVLLVAGSRAYPGAAVLAAEAALRCGAGIVHLAAPASIRDVLECQLTEIIVHAAPETAAGTCAAGTRTLLEPLLQRANALAIGPGLGRNAETEAWVRAFLQSVPLPAVIDADALASLPVAAHPGPRIVTPHVGELSQWLGADTEVVRTHRVETAVRGAREHRVIVVAKGAPTVVVTPDGQRSVNASGNPGLATAGSGDVLTGAISSFVAQGVSAERAAALAVFVHGAAADHLCKSQAPRSLRAREIAARLGAALLEIENPIRAPRV